MVMDKEQLERMIIKVGNIDVLNDRSPYSQEADYILSRFEEYGFKAIVQASLLIIERLHEQNKKGRELLDRFASDYSQKCLALESALNELKMKNNQLEAKVNKLEIDNKNLFGQAVMNKRQLATARVRQGFKPALKDNLTPELALDLVGQGKSVQEVAKMSNVSVATVYRRLSEGKGNSKNSRGYTI